MDGNERRDSRKERSLRPRHLVNALQLAGWRPFALAVLGAGGRQEDRSTRSEEDQDDGDKAH